MKKFLASLVAALLLGAGLVATSGAAATAAPSRCTRATQYTPCPKTSVHASGPKTVKKNKKAVLKVKATTNSNKRATGTITVTINPGNKKIVVTGYRTGSNQPVRLPKLKPGKYKITVTFDPQGQFRASTFTKRLKVTKK